MTQEDYDRHVDKIRTTYPRYAGVMIRTEKGFYLVVIPMDDNKMIDILEEVKDQYGLEAIHKITFGSLANHVFIDFDWEQRVHLDPAA